MQPNEIADILLGTMMPETRKCWELGKVHKGTPMQLIFRQTSYVGLLDIQKLSTCFQDVAKQVSWQGDEGDETDTPCIVIQGGVKGTLVQAVFSLKSPNED